MNGPRGRLAALAATLSVGALAISPRAALADVLAPESPASSSADASRTAYIVMLIVIVAVVIGLLGALLRAVRGGSAVEPEHRTRGTRGVQRRVGIGIGIAALVLFVVGVVFTEKARDVEASESGAEPIAIDVTAQQWIWRYEYPEPDVAPDGYATATPYSYYDLIIPVDTPVTLDVTSIDVLHRWWVPALARGVDAVPADSNTVTFTAEEVGTYEGRSTEFSGPAFATMRTAVHVVEPEEYTAFLEERTAEIQAARAAVQAAVDAGTAPGVALR